MIAWILRPWRRYRVRKECLSLDWIREQRLRERDHFDGVSWRWPVQKSVNEASHFQTRKLRRSA